MTHDLDELKRRQDFRLHAVAHSTGARRHAAG